MCILPPCCEVFQHVGRCWFKFDNLTMQPEFVDVAGCCSRLARSVQQCCTQACTPVWLNFNTQHVAIGWPNMSNMLHPPVLELLHSNVVIILPEIGICCFEMLRGVAIFWLGLKNNMEHYTNFKLSF